jgi:peptide/nickel transport system substrate-binding protein
MYVAVGGRSWTFRLRAGLRFTDGSPVTSTQFREALLAGLMREDHATRAWLLGSLTGVDRVRAGRPLPPLGIETPDPRTLVLRLSAPDSLLPEKLALPGVATPWKRRGGVGWTAAVGLGPYRVTGASAARGLELVRAAPAPGQRTLADTLRVRFVLGAPRVRTLLRHGDADLVWPVPPAFLEQAPPAGYGLREAEAQPMRRLLLVLRADVPPTTKLPARHVLANATNRADLLEALGARGRDITGWLPGAGHFDFARFDAAEARTWLERGKLGASFHVVLAYDADLAGADVARELQGSWARLGIYAEMRALRGEAAAAEPLRATAAQAQLVEAQALLPGAAAELACLVMPLRGPAVGSFRTGWRTREFDPWLLPGRSAPPIDAAAAQARLAEERIVIPVAELPWLWVGRNGPSRVRLDPRFGPSFSFFAP